MFILASSDLRSVLWHGENKPLTISLESVSFSPVPLRSYMPVASPGILQTPASFSAAYPFLANVEEDDWVPGLQWNELERFTGFSTGEESSDDSPVSQNRRPSPIP